MQRKFLSNLIFLLILNLLVKPYYLLGIEAEIQNRVGPEEFGHYFALINLSFLLNIFLDLGITNFNTRNIAQNHQLVSKHFAGISGLRMLLAILYLSLLLTIGFALGYELKQLWVLALLGINQALASWILYLRSNLTGLLLFRRDAVISILDRVVLIGAMFFLLFCRSDNSFQIEWLIYGQTAAYLISGFVGLIFVLLKTGKIKLQWKPVFFRMILKQSLPYALLILLMMVYYKTDSIMLERMLDDAGYQSGIYAMGYRLFEASNMIGYLFAVLLLPIFSNLLKAKKSVDEITSNAFRILFAGAATLAILCWIFGNEILSLIYSDHTLEALNSFRILMISFFFVSMTYVFGTLITATGKLRTLNMIALGGVVLNILLNLILIPKMLAFGSAVASLITQGIAAILQCVFALHLCKLRFSKSTIVSTILFSIALIIIWILSTIIHINWKLEFMLFLALAIAMSFVTRLIKKESLFDIVKSRR